jgi:uncharacterized RDD family membrane protein YckC
VPLDGWNTEERRHLRSLAAGAQLDIRWEGDAAVLVAADDEFRLRELVTSIRPEPGNEPAIAQTAPGTLSATATSTTSPMWAIDPTGRHEYRYWSGTMWTAHVADHGIQGADPLTEAPAGPPIAPPPGAYSGVAGTAWAGTGTSVAHPHDPTAVMGRRYVAFFIDVAISLAAFTIIFFPLATQRTVAETLRLPGCSRGSSSSASVQCNGRAVLQLGDTVYEADVAPTIALDVLFTFLYFGVLEGAMGAALGKRATGLRVVKADGSLQGVPKSLLRWLVFAVDGPLSLFLCGIITSSTSRGHRRLGDMSAQTYVVARESVGEPIEVG